MSQGVIIKALSGFYYIESDGMIYQTRAYENPTTEKHNSPTTCSQCRCWHYCDVSG